METVETKRSRRLWPVAIPLGAFGCVVGFLAYMLLQDDRDPSYMPSPLIGQAAPSVAGPSLLEGAEVGDDMVGAGKPVLVNFFASWCLPCRVEHPVLSEIVGETGIAVIGINYKDDPDAGRAFLDELGNPYAAVVTDRTGGVSINWGVAGLPETFVVDADGTVVYRHFGPILPEQRDELLRIVEDAS